MQHMDLQRYREAAFLTTGSHPAKSVTEIFVAREEYTSTRFEISVSDIFPAAWTEIVIMPFKL